MSQQRFLIGYSEPLGGFVPLYNKGVDFGFKEFLPSQQRFLFGYSEPLEVIRTLFLSKGEIND